MYFAPVSGAWKVSILSVKSGRRARFFSPSRLAEIQRVLQGFLQGWLQQKRDQDLLRIEVLQGILLCGGPASRAVAGHKLVTPESSAGHCCRLGRLGHYRSPVRPRCADRRLKCDAKMNQRVQRCDVNMNPVQSGPAQMGGRTDGQLELRKNMSTPLAYIIFVTHDLQRMSSVAPT